MLPSRAARRRGPLALIAVLLMWGSIVAGLSYANLKYQFTPARIAPSPSHWPQESRLGPIQGPSLVVFLHAYCPCSRATLIELEQVLKSFPSDGKAYCVVSYPNSREDQGNDLTASAQEIPRLQVSVDEDGRESELFGAIASGTVLFYDAAGKLQFFGGITPSRGHAGANPGVDFLLAAFKGVPKATLSTPVFGCGLPRRSSPSTEDRLSR